MSTVEMDQAAPESAAHHPLPDPGESVPRLALPTIGIFLATLTAFVGSTTAYISGWIPFWVTIPVNAAVTFVMFTVVHDASHYAISSIRWVNGLFGRLAWLFVGPVVAFPAFEYIHIQHHRHSNDDEQDPDTFASHGSLWVLPLRWSMVEYFYIKYYLPRGRSRPVIEVAETLVMMTLFLTGLIVAIVTGNFWTLAIVFLIPQRIGLTVLAWWFDWLPHHGLEDTQRSNRYRATRNRVGAEWLFTPVLLSQNYHLVHHLHPSVPFYRYLRTWRRNEEAYLERNAAISTVFGQQLNPDEYRQWKELNGRLARLLPVRMPARSSSPHAVLHRIPVASVDPITADATLVTFAVPEALRDAFRFEPGQHVTVRTDLGGQGIRRNYSICAPATRAQLRIAVKHIPGGAFSTFVANELKAGDVLELMTPTGRFGTPLDPLHRKHYVGLVAGSGITPVLSILATTLEIVRRVCPMLWPVILDTDSQLLVAQVDAGDEVPVVVKHSDLCLRLRQTGIDQHQSGPRLLWGFRTPVDQRQHRTEADQAARTGMFGNDGLHVGDLDIGRIRQRVQPLNGLQPRGCAPPDIEGGARRGGYRDTVNRNRLVRRQSIRVHDDARRRLSIGVH